MLLKRFQDANVREVFNAYPKPIRAKMMILRQLIFDVAASTEGVGPIQETLKWGEPAYITEKTKSGTTIRIDSKKANPTQYAIYFHCQTNLIETFRKQFPEQFQFEGNRAIVFDVSDEIPTQSLAECIGAALTYHLSKSSKKTAKQVR
ncbi:DUF1801 domain-containing protein [Bremerella cremea]|uniref:YdhG-like domain-containing protein n=1 Tax=Blastopirellula marina TaxID=124 RepID=A0A2S8FCI5_9BACT|nr:hypothetical protein C5Y83_26270 [Blastopirellula marina]RCS43179.1 DUF1801 domain-containing protein [Bremerella cremea]